MTLPAPRGPISEAVISALATDDPSRLPEPADMAAPADALTDHDLQLSLWVCYELHYQGFDSVAEHWEWQPQLLTVRLALEERLLAALRREVPAPGDAGGDASEVPHRLWSLIDNDRGPQLSRYMQKQAGLEQFREFAIQRSLYQLKEADPHTWAIPRLRGRSKAALVEIQVDEYGDGSAERMHSALFGQLLRGLGLDDGYAAYVDAVPGISLAISNVMTLFGLRRELRGALVGHLAAYEMTSSAPCRRYAKGLRRVGLAEQVDGARIDDATCAFYDVHVTADALHEQLAAHDLCGALAEDEPQLAEQIMFGAAACLHVENRFAEHVLREWSHGRSSLYDDRCAVRPQTRTKAIAS